MQIFAVIARSTAEISRGGLIGPPPPPPSFSSYQNSPVFLGLRVNTESMNIYRYLSNLKSTSRAEEHIPCRHSHVIEDQLPVTLGPVVEPEHRQRTLDGDARHVHWYQHHGLLAVPRRRGVRLAHEDADFAVGVHRPRDPPLLPIEDQLISLLPDVGRDVGGIRRGYLQIVTVKRAKYIKKEE